MKLHVTKDMVPSEDSSGWYMHSDDGTVRVWRYDRPEGGFYQRKETVMEDAFVAYNQAKAEASKGVKLKDYTHVGSIPLHYLFSPEHQIAEKLKEDDKDHLKWFLNSEKGQPFKTWWGKL